MLSQRWAQNLCRLLLHDKGNHAPPSPVIVDVQAAVRELVIETDQALLLESFPLLRTDITLILNWNVAISLGHFRVQEAWI